MSSKFLDANKIQLLILYVPSERFYCDKSILYFIIEVNKFIHSFKESGTIEEHVMEKLSKLTRNSTFLQNTQVVKEVCFEILNLVSYVKQMERAK